MKTSFRALYPVVLALGVACRSDAGPCSVEKEAHVMALAGAVSEVAVNEEVQEAVRRILSGDIELACGEGLVEGTKNVHPIAYAENDIITFAGEFFEGGPLLRSFSGLDSLGRGISKENKGLAFDVLSGESGEGVVDYGTWLVNSGSTLVHEIWHLLGAEPHAPSLAEAQEALEECSRDCGDEERELADHKSVDDIYEKERAFRDLFTDSMVFKYVNLDLTYEEMKESYMDCFWPYRDLAQGWLAECPVADEDCNTAYIATMDEVKGYCLLKVKTDWGL